MVSATIDVASQGMDINQAKVYLKEVLHIGREERKRVYQMLGLTTTVNGQTKANLGLTASLKTMTGVLWEQAKAWLASPLGMATVAITGIYLIVKAVDYFSKSVERAREKLEELKAEYNDNESELTSLNDEAETATARIEELQKLADSGAISLTEQEELDKLKAENRELERKINLLKLENELKQKQIQRTFVETVNAFTDDGFFASKGDQNFNQNLVAYQNYKSRLLALETQYQQDIAKAVEDGDEARAEQIQADYDRDSNYLQEHIDDLYDTLSKKSAELQTDMDGLSYIADPSTDLERQVNAALDYVNDLQDRLAIASGGENAKTDAINRLITQTFADTTEALRELGEQGAVTAGHLNDEKYDAFIQKLISLKVIADDTPESLGFVALAFNKLDSQIDSSVSRLQAIRNELRSLQAGGTVNLLDRPEVSGSQLREDGGWDVDDNDVATVFSSTYSNEAGTVAINFTPIIVDEDGNYVDTLSEEELTEYAEGVINGTRTDDLKLQIGSAFTGEDAIGKAEVVANKIHLLHEEMLSAADAARSEALNGVLSGFPEYTTQFESITESLSSLAEVQDRVNKGLTMSAEKVMELAKLYPEILQNATITANGQVKLNKDVVNSLVKSKRDEVNASIDAEIAKLTADKESLEAKMYAAEAQLELAKAVGEGEGQISKELAEYKLAAYNSQTQAFIDLGAQEDQASAMAAAAMVANQEEFGRIAKSIWGDLTDVQINSMYAFYYCERYGVGCTTMLNFSIVCPYGWSSC